MSCRNVVLVTAGFIALMGAGALPVTAQSVSPAISAAVKDAGRPDADKARDEARKPGEFVAFSGMKPGDKVVDMMASGGYFTRIFSKTVGPKGKVYAVIYDEIFKKRNVAADPIKALAADPNYKNVQVEIISLTTLKLPEPVDIIWTSQNYHDLKNAFFGPTDTGAVNKAVFSALKPGGIYIVLDHVAAPGSGARDTESLHRIDPAMVKAEVTAAGFVFEGESKILNRPADDHTKGVFDTAIRGNTDQFIYKFRKPK